MPAAIMSTARFPIACLALLVLLAACSSPQPTLAPDGGQREAPKPNRPTPEDLARLIGHEEKDYPLYAGDVIRISVQGHEELTVERKIPASGRIPLYGLDTVDEHGSPRVTEVDVAGLRIPDIETRLAALYSKIVNPPYVTVRVSEFAPKVIYVAGAVGTPRDYRLPDDARISLVQALTMAGWFTDDAAKDRVQVVRVDPTTGKRVLLPLIDVNRILAEGETGYDILLLPGDTITVDSIESRTVAIFGHIERPGEYPWAPGLTLVRLITLAGGTRTFAKLTNIKLLRGGNDSNAGATAPRDGAYEVDLKAVLAGEVADPELRPGDRIWIDERFI
jgi:polysaccharide export outer membrane protein